MKQRFSAFVTKDHCTDPERLARWIEASSVRLMLDREYPLGDVAQAVRDLAARRVRGKVAIIVAA